VKRHASYLLPPARFDFLIFVFERFADCGTASRQAIRRGQVCANGNPGAVSRIFKSLRLGGESVLFAERHNPEGLSGAHDFFKDFSFAQFGVVGDIPEAADYDADRKVDLAVFRPSSGVHYIFKTSNGNSAGTQFGAATDVPAASAYVR